MAEPLTAEAAPRRPPGARRALRLAAATAALALFGLGLVASGLGRQAASQFGELSIPAGSFGFSVAISADGSTALVGDPAHDNVQVFGRSGGAWVPQATLTPTGGVSGGFGGSSTGSSVALSADGSTALVGGFADNAFTGAAWVFVRSGSGTWSQQGPKLTPFGASGKPWFGSSLALTADGSGALVGGPLDSAGRGAVWSFIRTGSSWNQGSELQPPALTAVGYGTAIALTPDGTTAFIGQTGPTGAVGAVWVIHGSSATIFAPGDATADARFGTSLSVSADGSSVLVGGPGDSGGTGAAWLFTKGTSGVWVGGPKIVPDGVGPATQFGQSVAMNAAGTHAYIGGPGDGGGAGAVWSYSLIGLLLLNGKLVPSDLPAGAILGWSVAYANETSMFGAPTAQGVWYLPLPPAGATSAASSSSSTSTSTTSTAASSTTGSVKTTTAAAPTPIVSGVSPSTGPRTGGVAVTIQGSGFTGATGVLFGTVPGAIVAIASDGQVTAVAPAYTATGVVHVRVVGPGGTSAKATADQFTYTKPAPASSTSSVTTTTVTLSLPAVTTTSAASTTTTAKTTTGRTTTVTVAAGHTTTGHTTTGHTTTLTVPAGHTTTGHTTTTGTTSKPPTGKLAATLPHVSVATVKGVRTLSVTLWSSRAGSAKLVLRVVGSPFVATVPVRKGRNVISEPLPKWVAAGSGQLTVLVADASGRSVKVTATVTVVAST